jgi:hypothetical protein
VRYRNPAILAFAKEVEVCTGCEGIPPRGSIVAAHSNQMRHGKGASLKAHDVFIAYLCHDCHHAVDAGRWDWEMAQLLWQHAHERSVPLFMHLLTAEGWRLLDRGQP